MYPSKLSDEIGIVIRDPGGKLAAELKAARAAGQRVILRGTKRVRGPKEKTP